MLIEWNYFFATAAGAAGGLIGLIFVAISVNHTRILASSILPARALVSITFLFNILLNALLFLVPDQKECSLGIETAVTALLILTAVETLEVFILKRIDRALKAKQIIGFMLAQVALAPFVICAVSILLHREGAIYWIVPGIILSFLKALIDAWVLLIEINR